MPAFSLNRRSSQWTLVLVALLIGGSTLGGLAIAQGAQRAGTVVVVCAAAAVALWVAGGAFALVQARWLLWLWIHTALAAVAALLSVPLFAANAPGLGLSVLGATAALRALVVVRAFLARSSRITAAVCVLGGIDAALFCGLASATGHTAAALVVGGVVSLAGLFVSGLWLIRAALAGPRPVFGVARTLIDEAIRMKVALIFIVVLILVVPLLPALIDPELRLQYQMQTFLAWSLMVSSVLLGLMTVFLACATICSEIDRRQIFLTMTKPVSRFEYLLGKWIGIGLLNLLLICVLCGGIYTFAWILQETGTPRDAADWSALKWQVLTARRSVLPIPDEASFRAMVQQRKAELFREDSERYALANLTPQDEDGIRQTLLTRWHTLSPGNPQTFYFRGLENVKARATRARQRREQAQVRRLEELAMSTADQEQAARFNRWARSLAEALNMRSEAIRLSTTAQSAEADEAARLLDEARELSTRGLQQWRNAQVEAGPDLGELLNLGPDEVVQLRFKPKTSPRPLNELVRLTLRINDRIIPNDNGQTVHELANDNVHVLNLPTELASEFGVMAVQIGNQTIPASPPAEGERGGVTVSFTPGEGLDVLYRAGSFEGNVLRSALIMWASLLFLAMLGLMAGTFLGFPVACLLSLLIYTTGILSGFLTKSLKYYVPLQADPESAWDQVVTVFGAFWNSLLSGKVWDAFKVVIGLIGKGFVSVIPSFNEYNPVPLLTDGRMVDFGLLASAMLWVGLVGTGICGLIAWSVFRKRELARVMV